MEGDQSTRGRRSFLRTAGGVVTGTSILGGGSVGGESGGGGGGESGGGESGGGESGGSVDGVGGESGSAASDDPVLEPRRNSTAGETRVGLFVNWSPTRDELEPNPR